MDDLQLVSEIKSAGHQVKAIVVTGYSDISYLHQVSQLGIDDYILKPVQLELLYSTIDRCLVEITHDRHSRLFEDSNMPPKSNNHPISPPVESIRGEIFYLPQQKNHTVVLCRQSAGIYDQTLGWLLFVTEKPRRT